MQTSNCTTEDSFLQEILHNLFGYDSVFFQKIHPYHHPDQILQELANTSLRFLQYVKKLDSYPNELKRQYQEQQQSLFALYHDVLPKVFYQTFTANHLQFTTIRSNSLIQSLLNYFHQLITIVYLLRTWSQSKFVILPPSNINANLNEGGFIPRSLGNEDDYNRRQVLLEHGGHGGEEIFVIKSAIQRVLLALEQELHVIELQVKQVPSLAEQIHTPSPSQSSFLPPRKKRSITLLTFYQRCRQYDDLLVSLLGMIFNFHDNYDVFLPPQITTNNLTSDSDNNVIRSDFLQRYLNQISFLHQSQVILIKGQVMEYHPTLRNPTSTGIMKLSFDKGRLCKRQYFYLFMKQLFVEYVSTFTQQIMKAIWLNSRKVTITHNLPILLLSSLVNSSSYYGNHNNYVSSAVNDRNIQILKELSKYESNYDINTILQLLPRDSWFRELFEKIESSTEDCEIIHKISLPSSSTSLSRRVGGGKKKKSKKSNKEKDHHTITRNEFLEFIAERSKSFSSALLFPTSVDAWYSFLYLNHTAEGGNQTPPPSTLIKRLYDRSNTIEHYLKYHEIQDMNYLFHYLIGEISLQNLHYDAIKPILTQYQLQQHELQQCREYLLSYLDLKKSEKIKKNKEEDINDDNESEGVEEKKYHMSLTVKHEQFLTTSHQLQSVLTTENLEHLLHLLTPSDNITQSNDTKKMPKVSSSTTEVVTHQFIPYQHHYQNSFLLPFYQQLQQVQVYSYDLIDRHYSFSKHLLFLKQLFLFHHQHGFHYDNLRELCHFYVYFPTAPSLTDKRTLSSLTANPLLSTHRKVEGATGGGASFPFQSMRKSLELLTVQEFTSHEFHLLNNLQSTITLMIQGELPSNGIQSYYFHFPVMSEFFRLKSSMSSSSLPPFEHVFITLIEEMRLEVFYQWPLSMIFPQVLLMSSFQQIHQYLLRLQIMKWFHEFYWKSIISNNALQIQYDQLQQIHQERKVKKSEKQKKSPTSNKRSSTNSTTKKSPANTPTKPSEEDDDEEEGNEKEMKRRKEVIDIYDEEQDILLSKKQIQYQLLLSMSLIKCIYDYTMVLIHEYYWKECITSFTDPSSQHQSRRTIAGIRYSIEEMIHQIIQFINLFQSTIIILWKDLFTAFNELRHCLVLEVQYLYQRQEEQLKQHSIQPNDTSASSYRITKNQRLIAFRITEKAFQKMSGTVKQLHEVIREAARAKRSSHTITPPLTGSEGRREEKEELAEIEERRKKLIGYRMKILDEMYQRLQGNF